MTSIVHKITFRSRYSRYSLPLTYLWLSLYFSFIFSRPVAYASILTELFVVIFGLVIINFASGILDIGTNSVGLPLAYQR